ncbi:hypothetical protein [Streptomyces sp. NPDC096311]|uniref:hypothetical protein n=1 Tax=Streptomyces sp. NPDC096311 TaxID=3366083 RepID=UPI003819725E
MRERTLDHVRLFALAALYAVWPSATSATARLKDIVIAENFDVFDVTLTPDEVSDIDALDTGLCSGPAPENIRRDTFGTR